MSTNITRFYSPATFEPRQIKDAFEKLPEFLMVDKNKCSLTAKYNYSNGIQQDKSIDWKNLDTICEVKHDSLYCLLFSYFPRGEDASIIYIESRWLGDLFIHCVAPDLDMTKELISILENKLSLSPIKEEEAGPSKRTSGQNGISLVESICNRFHLVARQMLSRHSNRETLIINDEYDTQDLLHALLHIYFDDIRQEEWTPSYAGGSSRVDFLLKDQKIIIEVKKTRKTLNAKQLGDELLIDIQRYQSHPDCKTLICFVYDPEEMISNPFGLENDLNQEDKDFIVKVIIVPKRY